MKSATRFIFAVMLCAFANILSMEDTDKLVRENFEKKLERLVRKKLETKKLETLVRENFKKQLETENRDKSVSLLSCAITTMYKVGGGHVAYVNANGGNIYAIPVEGRASLYIRSYKEEALEPYKSEVQEEEIQKEVKKVEKLMEDTDKSGSLLSCVITKIYKVGDSLIAYVNANGGNIYAIPVEDPVSSYIRRYQKKALKPYKREVQKEEIQKEVKKVEVLKDKEIAKLEAYYTQQTEQTAKAHDDLGSSLKVERLEHNNTRSSLKDITSKQESTEEMLAAVRQELDLAYDKIEENSKKRCCIIS